MVDGKPFLMRGGEFSNNVYESPKDISFLEMMLDAYKGYDMNTLLVPISWRSLEPQEGTFDFRMIDNLIEQCHKRDLRVVILWFGAIKNGGLHYAPRWVVNDRTPTRGFGKLTEGEQQETPPFAAILKMGENDLVIIGKTMRVELAKAGADQRDQRLRGHRSDQGRPGRGPMD
jgi:hypothetical protein